MKLATFRNNSEDASEERLLNHASWMIAKSISSMMKKTAPHLEADAEMGRLAAADLLHETGSCKTC